MTALERTFLMDTFNQNGGTVPQHLTTWMIETPLKQGSALCLECSITKLFLPNHFYVEEFPACETFIPRENQKCSDILL